MQVLSLNWFDDPSNLKSLRWSFCSVKLAVPFSSLAVMWFKLGLSVRLEQMLACRDTKMLVSFFPPEAKEAKYEKVEIKQELKLV